MMEGVLTASLDKKFPSLIVLESSAKRRIVETNFSGKLLMYGKKGMSPRLSLEGLLTQHMYNFNDHHL